MDIQCKHFLRRRHIRVRVLSRPSLRPLIKVPPRRHQELLSTLLSSLLLPIDPLQLSQRTALLLSSPPTRRLIRVVYRSPSRLEAASNSIF